jgi:light-regulated signal transduction histidine kinase (bacteriophytochrome)
MVKDNGIGLDSQYSDKFFDMFQRLHGRSDYPGTGVDLAICRKTVVRHGGEIWVDPQPGQGSTFYFTMPKSQSNLVFAPIQKNSAEQVIPTSEVPERRAG